ncbi:MAG: AAA family ATPase, partial [Polyangiales bacterium]
ALARARTARARFADMHHHGQRYAAYLEGLLEQTPEGNDRCEQTHAWLSDQGWKNPGRALTLYLPLLALLEPAYGRRSSSPDGGSTRLFQRYEVLSSADRTLGATLSARDVQTGRLIALRQLGAQRGTALEQFKQVFRALSELRHPNIVAMEALFEHGGHWFMALEHIDGPDLLGHVRPDGRCHAARLYPAFEGLARGLTALHEAGFVHRDVRPDRVRVAPGGRAVLCEFGLMARLDARGELRPGTVDFAAPEQLAGAPPAPSADVYALGCCLYRALHGASPFQARSPAAMLEEKRQRAPRAPGPLYDPQLEVASALALRALAPEPAHRPTMREVLALLARRSEPTDLGAAADAPRDEEPGFTGRELELAALGACFEETCDAGFTVALVCGESGVGKSALVSTFAARTRESYPMLLVLSGRCYESEQIALKAFDGVVDQLAALLRELPNPTCEALLPRNAALLAQLFPVLTSVTAIASAQRKGLPADPAARRIAARASFVELLERLSAVYELVLVIDDLQWADAESFSLLRALSSRAEALPFLCLCTTRPDEELSPGAQRELSQLRHLDNTEVLPLEGLSDEATAALARALYGPSLPEARLDALVRESKGHPMFLRELVEHEKSGRALTASALTLDGALRARIASFDDTTRALLALVALGERPHAAHVFARALERSELPRGSLDLLLRRSLLRYRGETELACFHDCIRRATLGALGEEAHRALSRALARALAEEPGDASAECARLWDAGGDLERAVATYELAGDRTLAGLAFAQASLHYARALSLLTRDDASVPDAHDVAVRRLLVGRANALVRGGHSAAGAALFLQAAEGARGEEQARLRLLGAQHRIRGGELAEGLAAAGALLAELGLTLPRSERTALARIAFERLRARLRGGGLRVTPGPRETSQHERLRLDALHGLSGPVRDVAFLPGSALLAQYLRRALVTSEPAHAARALANEALWREVSAPRDQEDPLFAEAAALAASAGEPAPIAEVATLRGLACLARNQFRRAPEHLARAHELVKERCPGEPWLLTSVRMYLGAAWFHGGDHAAIVSQTGAWVDEARSRDDRYALAALTGFGNASVRHLLRDAPEDALEELEEAFDAWPDEPFTSIHFGAFMTRGYVLSSLGPGDHLLAWLDGRDAWLRGAFLMRTPTCREALLVQRVRGQMLALDGTEGAHNRARLDEVQRHLRELGRHRTRGAGAMRAAYGGMVHALEGRGREALASFDQARATMGPGGWWVILGLDYVAGRLTGGDAGRALCDAVLSRLREEGWRDPRRGLALRVPVLHLLA